MVAKGSVMKLIVRWNNCYLYIELKKYEGDVVIIVWNVGICAEWCSACECVCLLGWILYFMNNALDVCERALPKWKRLGCSVSQVALDRSCG